MSQTINITTNDSQIVPMDIELLKYFSTINDMVCMEKDTPQIYELTLNNINSKDLQQSIGYTKTYIQKD